MSRLLATFSAAALVCSVHAVSDISGLKLCNINSAAECNTHNMCAHLANGQCSDAADNECGYTCICKAGWEGDNCDQKIACDTNHCNGHGTIGGNKVDGCTCTCNTHYSGATCATRTVTDCTGLTGPQTIIVKKNGVSISIDTYCFRIEGMDGQYYYVDGKSASGLSSNSATSRTSCPAGTQIWVPRSKDHMRQVSTEFGESVSRAIGVYGHNNGCGCCTHHAMKSTTCQDNHWSGLTNTFDDMTTPSSPWFIMDHSISEPNGDYHAGCWLHTWYSGGVVYHHNDAHCHYSFSSYICSTNRFTQ
eukprot:g4579.t1